MDQELVVPCPECSFASQSKIVGKHLRMFHSKKKIQNYNVSGGMRQFRNDAVNFVCQKCQYSDMLYYNIKKHVLVSHFQNLISAYFEETLDESEENFTDHYCKKCNACANSRDSLIYHILTSEVHKDLENILGPVISVQPKKTGQAKSLQIINIAPKPSTANTVSQMIPTSVGSNSTSHFQLPLPPVNQNQNTVSTKAVHNVVGPLSVSGSANSRTASASTSADRLHIAFLSGSRPVNQNSVGLQPSVSQPVFVSQRFPLKQPVRPRVFCLNQPTGNMSRAVLPGVISFPRPIRPTLLPLGNQSVRAIGNPIMPGPGPVPVNKPSSPGVLAVNRPIGSGPGVLPVPQTITSGVLQFNHPVTPGILPANPSTGPGIVQFNQPVTPDGLPVNQSVTPGVSQNATLLTTGSMFRQLIPTGKQVNGIPTYTLAPVSMTLPGAPGSGVATVPPPQVPVQLMPSGPVAQLSQGPATMPSAVAVSSSTNALTKTSLANTAMNLVLKQAKQWKTCPVCSELFPSNVYQVHMQVAHKCSTSKAEMAREVDKVAVYAPFLRWLKDKTVRCFCCKCFLTQAEILKHIFIHGLTCLFCTSIFYDLKSLVTHTRTAHKGKKELHSDYEDKGFQLASDSEGQLIFPHFDFSITSKELGEREVHLVALAGVNSKTLIPLYIKVQQEDAGTSRENKKVSTCPFCFGIFTSTDAYEMHLKEQHQIMPTVHPVLKTPAFKCIHCCGVYTGNMTLTAVTVHLLRCRSAREQTLSAMKMQADLREKQDLPLLNGENHEDAALLAKRKQSDHLYAACVSEDQSDEDPPFFIINNGADQIPVKEVNCVPSKRQKSDHKTETKGEISVEDLNLLVLNPKPFQQSSNEVQKRFLADYFHKKPYPSKKELQLLSSMLRAWKVDVASFFGRKRYFCLKAIKNAKPSVLLGFSMSELRNVKHSLNLNCESEGV
ncbi:activity-dependent neuroprotector homeobox protein 2 isoform X2 [Erythrolamprus reginae]